MRGLGPLSGSRIFVWFLLCHLLHHSSGTDCSPILFKDAESVVCVCNATFCDTYEHLYHLEKGSYAVYTSSKAGLRMHRETSKFVNSSYDEDDLTVTINRTQTYQKILGFGGAFTDAAGININSLELRTQDMLLNSYFSGNGNEYTLGRVPMASCDFSTRLYSYNDVPNDFNMNNFSLAREDTQYKIPIISKALDISTQSTSYPMVLFASPWSAPAWMKTNKNMTGRGQLIGAPGGPYYKAWAEYFSKFLTSYAYYNISFWGITIQNEPTDGMIPGFPFQSMGWTPEQMRDFIIKDLGPTLTKYGYADLRVMVMDDQRLFIEKWADVILSSKEASAYVSGIAVHWYMDFITPYIALSNTHKKYPDKFILATEACEGSDPWQVPKVSLGSWQRAESYSHDIIQDLQNWVAGWTDWNLALDMQGGPNWVKNFVDSPIIVNADKDEFYKQPMFYVMGHFSKYIKPNATRIGVGLNKQTTLEFVVFTVPQNFNPDATVVVVSNRGAEDVPFKIQDFEQGFIGATAPAHSIQTYIWWSG